MHLSSISILLFWSSFNILPLSLSFNIHFIYVYVRLSIYWFAAWYWTILPNLTSPIALYVLSLYFSLSLFFPINSYLFFLQERRHTNENGCGNKRAKAHYVCARATRCVRGHQSRACAGGGSHSGNIWCDGYSLDEKEWEIVLFLSRSMCDWCMWKANSCPIVCEEKALYAGDTLL